MRTRKMDLILGGVVIAMAVPFACARDWTYLFVLCASTAGGFALRRLLDS